MLHWSYTTNIYLNCTKLWIWYLVHCFNTTVPWLPLSSAVVVIAGMNCLCHARLTHFLPLQKKIIWTVKDLHATYFIACLYYKLPSVLWFLHHLRNWISNQAGCMINPEMAQLHLVQGFIRHVCPFDIKLSCLEWVTLKTTNVYTTWS